jgi:hypothetical protein
MRDTENLRIGSNNEIEGRFVKEARRRSPDISKEIAAQSRLNMSGHNLAMHEETSGSKVKVRDRLEQQEASERFLSGQSIKWLEEPNTTRIFHGIYFTTAPLLD